MLLKNPQLDFKRKLDKIEARKNKQTTKRLRNLSKSAGKIIKKTFQEDSEQVDL